MRRLRWLCAAAPWLLLAGCGADDPVEVVSAPTQDPEVPTFEGTDAPDLRPERPIVDARPSVQPPDEVCVSNEAFFLDEVWTPVLSSACFRCHNPLGAASQSGMVFRGSDQHGFLAHNLEVFTNTAAFERDGVSIVLLKPTGQVDHGGDVQIEADGPEVEAFEAMLARIADPVVCDEGPADDGGFFAGVERLDPARTLRKASLSLAGRLPTEAEQQAVEAHGMQAFEAILDRMMREEGFYQIFMGIWGDVLMTDKYLGGRRASQLLDLQFYPHARWYYDDNYDRSGEDLRFVSLAARYTNDSVAREPLMLIRHVLQQDLPFTEVLTADYAMLNPFSARAYGVEGARWANPLDPDEYQALQIPGLPHAGVLSSPMVLNRFPTTDTNRNRHRAVKIYDFFLDTDILSLGQRPIDPTSTVHNPTLNDPQCTGCHAVLDPLAGAFQNWDARGSFAPRDSWYEGMLAPGFAGEEITQADRAESLQWLARRIVSDERYPRATARIIFRGLTGREPLSLPEQNAEDREARLRAYEVQQAFFKALGEDFMANGADVRRMIKAIVRSDWFRADNYEAAMDEVRAAELRLLGVGRRLTPEMLHRRIEAIFGIPWRAAVNSPDALLDVNQYRILYGGIDFDDVTERLEAPNGIMSAIQQLMANDVACRNVALDFAQEERVLFPMVEMGYTPEDDNGFEVPMAIDAIRRNIQHLHRHILGESLALDDPEIDRTYRLFFDTWREGVDLMAAGEVNVGLSYFCQGRVDFFTSAPIPAERRVLTDPLYTARAWRAVVSYLLMDYRFLYD